MNIEYLRDGWIKGQEGDFKFEAKVYEQPSKYGINEGRISKLTIFDKNNMMIINYDRGWDIKPRDITEGMYLNILKKLESL